MVVMEKEKRALQSLQVQEVEGQRKERSLCVLVRVWVTGVLFFLAFHCVEGSTSPMISPLPYDLPSPVGNAVSQSPPLALPPKGVEAAMQSTSQHYSTELLLPIVLASVAFLAVFLSVMCIYVFWLRRGHKAPLAKDIESSGATVTKEVSLGPIFGKFSSIKAAGKKAAFCMVDYAALVSATNNFSDNNILGEGGFSRVYKACFNDGYLAAVKKIDGAGKDFEREFQNELNLLANISHPNIVSLLDHCVNGEQRFIVYELMQNGSLELQLHGPSHGSALTWHIRMKIALDIARGLEYLHEHCSPPVIHRDLKSSNILLDNGFNAKISDFGLAVTSGSHNKGTMKLSGTIGYVAPEYLLDGKLTEKSDVYAFGVVLLELLLGRKPIEKTAPSHCQSIVTWAMPQLTDRMKLPSIVDPVIRNSMDPKHLFQVAAVAVLCVQPEPSYRPLITDVLHSLVPLVPIEIGGTLRITENSSFLDQKHSSPSV